MGELQRKEPFGRPTKYCTEIVSKAQEYLDNIDIKTEAVPSIAGLSLALDLNRETIHRWIKEEGKEDFSNIVKQIASKQEQLLIHNGLNNTFNASITKLILSKHGYSEKVAETGSQGITVNVSRGTVTIEHGSDKLTVSDIEAEQVVIEHE